MFARSRLVRTKTAPDPIRGHFRPSFAWATKCQAHRNLAISFGCPVGPILLVWGNGCNISVAIRMFGRCRCLCLHLNQRRQDQARRHAD